MRWVSLFRLEAQARRWILLFGAAVGLMSWFLPMIAKHSWSIPADERMVPSTVYTLGVVAATAIVLGLGLTGPDLQDGRMGIFLGRPVGPGQLYASRFIVSVLLTVCNGLLVLLPAAMAMQDPRLVEWGGLVVLILGSTLLLMADLVSTALRSQSAWLLLDLVSWVLAGAVLKWERSVLFGSSQPPMAITDLLIPLWISAIALFLAGALKLPFGRGDLHRSHRVQSMVFAGGLAIAVASAWALVPGRILI